MEAFYCVEWEKLLYECAAASFDALRGKRCCAAIDRMHTDRLTDAYRLSVYRKPELHKFVLYYSSCFFDELERRGKRKCCESLEFARNR